jgi:hypothetical protein
VVVDVVVAEAAVVVEAEEEAVNMVAETEIVAAVGVVAEAEVGTTIIRVMQLHPEIKGKGYPSRVAT